MRDFASFDGGKDGGEGKGEGNGERIGADLAAEAQKALSSMAGRDENDVVREIYARAEAGKRNGTLTNDQIDAFYRQIAPLLDDRRRKRLKKLVEKLKSL